MELIIGAVEEEDHQQDKSVVTVVKEEEEEVVKRVIRQLDQEGREVLILGVMQLLEAILYQDQEV